ncbi:MAG: FHA domain-containing protein [Chthonomonas sp.]|nr:FHA domain-containing protein [Chthonomonas sp.]
MNDETVTELEETPETVQTDESIDAPVMAATAAATLTLVRNGAPTDEIFPIGASATIGRFDPSLGPIDVDLATIPEGSYVSRKHAVITCEASVWKVVDLGSSNGTFVRRADFEKVEAAELTDGTEIAFGNARFVFNVTEVTAPED